MMIEEHLAALGYDTGTVDGEADVKTAVAISQFQAEMGREVTGQVSPQLAGILSAEVDKAGAAPAPTAVAATPTPSPSPTPQSNAAQQACLQQKIAAAEQAKPKKKTGFGRAFSSLANTVEKYGGNDVAADVATVSSEVLDASATVGDLTEAARELGISESEIADCQVPVTQMAGGAAVGGATVGGAAGPAAQPSGQNLRYPEQGAFQGGSYTLGQLDATLEACTGTRPGYRAEVDALVTEAHPSYRAEALSLYDSRYQSMSQAMGSVPSGTCPDAQLASLRRQADATLESLRPKVLPSAPVVQSAGVSTGAASASTTNAVSTPSASPGPSVAIEEDAARLYTMSEHCAVMSNAYGALTGGLTGVGGRLARDRNVTDCTCSGAFRNTLQRARPAYENLITGALTQCYETYPKAVADYATRTAAFEAARSNIAALRQQVVAEYSASGLTPDRLFNAQVRGCENNGGQDCEVWMQCRSLGSRVSVPCVVFVYGSGSHDEVAWYQAQDALIASGEAINFANMSARLPSEMSSALIAEGAAYEADCDLRESDNQNKLKNCGCYKDVYLDERVKTKLFETTGEFKSTLVTETWAKCINEDGYRDYMMRSCMQADPNAFNRGPEHEAAYRTYCECSVEPQLDEVKIQTEHYGSVDWAKVMIKSDQVCRALKP